MRADDSEKIRKWKKENESWRVFCTDASVEPAETDWGKTNRLIPQKKENGKRKRQIHCRLKKNQAEKKPRRKFLHR